MKRAKKIGACLLSAAMVFSLYGCTPKQDTQQAFDAFMHRQFVQAVEQDYTTAHILLENPQAYGVDMANVDVTLGQPWQPDDADQAREELAQLQREFAQFDRDALTAEQQDTYDIVAFLLQTSEQGSDPRFDYHSSAFETMTGVHTQLPTFFTDITLRDEQDVQDLIALLQSVQPYVEGLLQYTRRQAEQGMLMVDIDAVIAHCQEIVDAGTNSAVLQSMKANVAGIAMDDAQKEAYQQQIEQAFTGSFLPAYQQIIDTMDALRDQPNNTQGLAHLPDGKAYYEILLRQQTGTEDSVEQVRRDLEEMMQQSWQRILAIAYRNPQAYQTYLNDEAKTPYTDYDTMLRALENFTRQNFPDVGTFAYEIKPLDPEVATSGVAAYFNVPALDGTTKQQIRVNTSSTQVDVQSLSTFGTVAHEGFPGHMYQIRYAYQHIDDPFRNGIASFPGYTEGYATYVQLLSLDYLTDIDADVRALDQHMQVYSFCMTALADIGIHYEGWSLQQFQTFLPGGQQNPSAAEEAYAQIQANPGAFLPYYVGYVQFAQLREQAETALGEQFDEKAFHQAILQSGSAPFELVERNVQQYIQQTQADQAKILRPAA